MQEKEDLGSGEDGVKQLAPFQCYGASGARGRAGQQRESDNRQVIRKTRRLGRPTK